MQTHTVTTESITAWKTAFERVVVSGFTKFGVRPAGGGDTPTNSTAPAMDLSAKRMYR